MTTKIDLVIALEAVRARIASIWKQDLTGQIEVSEFFTERASIETSFNIAMDDLIEEIEVAIAAVQSDEGSKSWLTGLLNRAAVLDAEPLNPTIAAAFLTVKAHYDEVFAPAIRTSVWPEDH